MRPIFTIHAGEYIVGDFIEANFRDFKVWVPSKDDGTDLLVTNKLAEKVTTLQVKFSKDHLAGGRGRNAMRAIKSGGWWQFNPNKIELSNADYWVLVLSEVTNRKYDFVVIKPQELVNRYKKIAPNMGKIQSYFWVTHDGRCWVSVWPTHLENGFGPEQDRVHVTFAWTRCSKTLKHPVTRSAAPTEPIRRNSRLSW
jgi:hypothetical protein